MSIIYDALKKVDRPVKPVRNTTQINSNAIVSNELNKGTLKKYKVILAYALIILLGLFVGNITFNMLIHPKAKPASYPNPMIITQAQKATSAPAPLANAVSLPQEEKPANPNPSLTLNGVFFQEDKGYALINNRILYTGDKIEGATIKGISLEKVDLEFEGRIITLINSSR